MEQGSITIQKTARYFTLGKPGPATKHLWFVLHGYGQLANYFLRNFSALIDQDTVVIAPEGLHRYYKQGYSGRVGASWMTKEDRLDDIADYVKYLDDLAIWALTQMPNAQIHVLGFSQGGATASRWVCEGKVKPASLTLWASVFPPDLDFKVSVSRFSELNLHVVVGRQDEFITDEKMQEHCSGIKAKNIRFELLQFDQGHIIHEPTLLLLRDKLYT